MTRGVFRPFDRDKHWVAAIGVDEATSYGAGRALEAAEPGLAAVSRARDLGHGAKRAWWASRALSDRRPLEVVGADWFHSVADRRRAVEQIGDGFRALAADLSAWGMPDPGKVAATAQWMEVDVIPAMVEWNAWQKSEADSWLVRAATTWETFEKWEVRLRRLRELARAHGIALASPEPPRLEQTILQMSDAGTGGRIGGAIGAAKFFIAAAIGVAGVFTVIGVTRELRDRLKAPPDED